MLINVVVHNFNMSEKFIPPQKIHITSDDTIIEFVSIIPKGKNLKDDMYVYKYTKSKHFLGKELSFRLEDLKKQLKYFFKEIK